MIVCISCHLLNLGNICFMEHSKKLKGAKVLLVEDDFMSQEVTLALLKQNGIQATLAHNGQEALELLEQDDFDGVLMDCEMPIMNGYIATQKIRQQSQFEQLPIIAITANTNIGDRDKVLNVGMNDYIPKPININDMLVIMAKWIKPSELNFSELIGINIAFGLALTEQNTKLYAKLLIIFQTSQNEFRSHFNDAMKLNDFKQMTYLAHSLKGATSSIGASDLQDSGGLLEIACQTKEKNIVQIASATAQELDHVLLGIQQFKQSNKKLLTL